MTFRQRANTHGCQARTPARLQVDIPDPVDWARWKTDQLVIARLADERRRAGREVEARRAQESLGEFRKRREEVRLRRSLTSPRHRHRVWRAFRAGALGGISAPRRRVQEPYVSASVQEEQAAASQAALAAAEEAAYKRSLTAYVNQRGLEELEEFKRRREQDEERRALAKSRGRGKGF